MTKRSHLPVRIALVLTIALAASSAAWQQPELKQRVAQLIAQLDGETRQERTAAAQALIKLGPDVLEELPALDVLPTAAARDAVRRIRIQLERVEANRSLDASTVTLTGRLSLTSAVDAVAAQTKNRIKLGEVPPELLKQELELELQEVPFWQAVDEVCKLAGLELAESGDPLVLTAAHAAGTAASGASAPAYFRAFRIAALSAERRPVFGDEQRELLRVRLSVMAEPRLRPLFLKVGGSDITAAVPSLGRLAAFNPDASLELPLAVRGGALDLQCDFLVRRTAQFDDLDLRGKFAVLTAAGAESFDFSDLTSPAGTALRRGGVTVRLLGAPFEGPTKARSARVRLLVSYDTGGPAFESHRSWMYHNLAWLVENESRRIAPAGPITTLLQTDGALLVEYGFEQLQAAPREYTFHYVAPTLLVDAPVEFDIAQVPVSASAIQRTHP